MLDDKQKRVEDSLFQDGAAKVTCHFHTVPYTRLVDSIPLPGSAQAMSRSRVSKSTNTPKITFDNKMQAVLAERRFRAFPAFSLSELMEF